MWHRYKMTPGLFKGHFKVKVKYTFSSWVATEDSHSYEQDNGLIFFSHFLRKYMVFAFKNHVQV